MIIAIVILAILGAVGYLYFLKHKAQIEAEVAALEANFKARLEALEAKVGIK